MPRATLLVVLVCLSLKLVLVSSNGGHHYAAVDILLLSSNSGQTVTSQVAHDGDPATTMTSVTLEASCSDAPHDKLRFNWACTNADGLSQVTQHPRWKGYAGKGRNITVSVPAGTHSCVVTVEGGNYLPKPEQTKTVTITINAEANTDPACSWDTNKPDTFTVPHDGSPTTGIVEVLLAGMASDPDSDAYSCEWGCGTDTHGSCSPTVSFAAGSHSCTMTVTDSYAQQSTLSRTITVNSEPNQAPLAAAGADVTVTAIHDKDGSDDKAEVVLDGSSSTVTMFVPIPLTCLCRMLMETT